VRDDAKEGRSTQFLDEGGRGGAEALKAEGLDVAVLFDEAGLDMAALSDPDSRFPTERVSLLWQLAVARSGDPAIGLANSNIAKPASFDVVAYTMLPSPNLLGILEREPAVVQSDFGVMFSEGTEVAISVPSPPTLGYARAFRCE